jgi:hypothetical protein
MEDTEENNKVINEAIEIYIRDNMPTVPKKKGGYEKAICEFCRSKHSPSEEYCDLKVEGVDLNTFDGANTHTI